MYTKSTFYDLQTYQINFALSELSRLDLRRTLLETKSKMFELGKVKHKQDRHIAA